MIDPIKMLGHLFLEILSSSIDI